MDGDTKEARFRVGDKVRVNALGLERISHMPEHRNGKITEVKKADWMIPPTRQPPFYYLTDGEDGGCGTWEDFLELDDSEESE